jgi:hypothetical protein
MRQLLQDHFVLPGGGADRRRRSKRQTRCALPSGGWPTASIKERSKHDPDHLLFEVAVDPSRGDSLHARPPKLSALLVEGPLDFHRGMNTSSDAFGTGSIAEAYQRFVAP